MLILAIYILMAAVCFPIIDRVTSRWEGFDVGDLAVMLAAGSIFWPIAGMLALGSWLADRVARK